MTILINQMMKFISNEAVKVVLGMCLFPIFPAVLQNFREGYFSSTFIFTHRIQGCTQLQKLGGAGQSCCAHCDNRTLEILIYVLSKRFQGSVTIYCRLIVERQERSASCSTSALHEIVMRVSRNYQDFWRATAPFAPPLGTALLLSFFGLHGTVSFFQSHFKSALRNTVQQQNIVEYVVCPKCNSLYLLEDCIIGRNGREESKLCEFVEYPRHTQRSRRTKCSTPLLKRE